MRQPRIVTFDIETSPVLGWVWEAYDATVNHVEQDWFLLSYAYQVYGQKKVHVKGLCDCKNPKSDKELVMDLWQMCDEADILVGHNIDRFDVKKMNDRFIFYGLKSPSHYRTVDTVKAYRKVAKSTKANLNYLCDKLDIGKKTPHQGFDLWLSCMKDRTKTKDWKLMLKYNAQDVRINTELYTRLRPWIDNHPNLGVFLGGQCCTNCGSDNITSHGFRYAQGTRYRRLQCQDCGAHMKQTIKKNGEGGRISGK